MADISGEYWVIDGQVDFADGDVGDRNHEMIAIDSIVSQYVDRVESLADELDIPTDFHRYDEPDPEGIQQVLNQIHDALTTDSTPPMNDQQANAYMMQHIGCDKEAYKVLWGGGDAREYVIEHMGWIAVRSNNVEVFGYDAQRQKEIADAIRNILYEEQGLEDDSYQAEEVELSIYDYHSNKSWYVTLADLESPEVQVRPQQLPSTTYNKSLYNFSNPRDEEENKYSRPTKSRQNPWTTAAQKAKMVGPGQQLWRGTSESMNFADWFRLLSE